MEGGGKLVKRFMGLRGSLIRPTSWTDMHDIIHDRSGNVIQDKVKQTKVDSRDRGAEYTDYGNITTWTWA
jgi:hypothetical protein